MSLRVLDFRCVKCQKEIRDELIDLGSDPFPECCGATMERIFNASPLVDAREEWFCKQTGRRFSSYHGMDKALSQPDEMGRTFTTLSKEEFNNMRWDAEKRYEKRRSEKLAEATRKSIYRVRHGYRDFPDLPTERND